MTHQSLLVHLFSLGIILFGLSLIISSYNLGINISDLTGSLSKLRNGALRISSKSGPLKSLIRVVRHTEDSVEMDLVTSDIFIAEFFEAANRYRAIHGVPKLKRNETLLKDAQEWAEILAGRSDQAGTPIFNYSHKYMVGESIWGGRNFSEVSGTTVVSKWYSECPKHNWDNNFFLPESSHFSQLVWKGTETAGIAKITSPKQGITIVVARYFPAGNWAYRSAFKDNVFPGTVRQNDRQETAIEGQKCFKGTHPDDILKYRTPTNPKRHISHNITVKTSFKRRKFEKNYTTDASVVPNNALHYFNEAPTTIIPETTTAAGTTQTTIPTTVPIVLLTPIPEPTTVPTTTFPPTTTTPTIPVTTNPTTVPTPAPTTATITTTVTTPTTVTTTDTTTTVPTTVSTTTISTTVTTTDTTTTVPTTVPTTTIPTTVTTTDTTTTVPTTTTPTVDTSTPTTVLTTVSTVPTTIPTTTVPETTVAPNPSTTSAETTTISHRNHHEDTVSSEISASVEKSSSEDMKSHGRGLHMTASKSKTTASPKHIMVLVTNKADPSDGNKGSDAQENMAFSFDEYDDPFDEIRKQTFDEYDYPSKEETNPSSVQGAPKQKGRALIMPPRGDSSKTSENERKLILNSDLEPNDNDNHPKAENVKIFTKSESSKFSNSLNRHEHILKEISHHIKMTALQNRELLHRMASLEKIFLNLAHDSSTSSTSTTTALKVSSSSTENLDSTKSPLQEDDDADTIEGRDSLKPQMQTGRRMRYKHRMYVGRNLPLVNFTNSKENKETISTSTITNSAGALNDVIHKSNVQTTENPDKILVNEIDYDTKSNERKNNELGDRTVKSKNIARQNENNPENSPPVHHQPSGRKTRFSTELPQITTDRPELEVTTLENKTDEQKIPSTKRLKNSPVMEFTDSSSEETLNNRKKANEKKSKAVPDDQDNLQTLEHGKHRENYITTSENPEGKDEKHTTESSDNENHEKNSKKITSKGSMEIPNRKAENSSNDKQKTQELENGSNKITDKPRGRSFSRNNYIKTTENPEAKDKKHTTESSNDENHEKKSKKITSKESIEISNRKAQNSSNDKQKIRELENGSNEITDKPRGRSFSRNNFSKILKNPEGEDKKHTTESSDDKNHEKKSKKLTSKGSMEISNRKAQNSSNEKQKIREVENGSNEITDKPRGRSFSRNNYSKTLENPEGEDKKHTTESSDDKNHEKKTKKITSKGSMEISNRKAQNSSNDSQKTQELENGSNEITDKLSRKDQNTKIPISQTETTELPLSRSRSLVFFP